MWSARLQILVVELAVLQPDATVGEAQGGWLRERRRDPVDGAADLAPVLRRARARLGIDGGTQLGHLARRVLAYGGAAQDVGVAEAHFVAGREALPALGRYLHEV